MATNSRSTLTTRPLATMVIVSVLASLLAVVGSRPAAAELASLATTTWGVEGLRTGTQTDNIDAPVFTMETIGNTLYVGGRFLSVTDGVTSQPQAGLAAFDATTGAWIAGFAPQLNGAVYALRASPDGTRLFVGGDFTTTNGAATGALVALDPSTGAIDSSWTGRVGGYQLVRDIDVDADEVYVAGGFTSISSAAGGNSAGRVARFDLSTGVQDSTWRPTIGGGSIWGISVSRAAGRIYLAGTFTSSNAAAVTGGFVSLQLDSPVNTTGVAPLQVNATRLSAQYAYDVLAVNGKVFVAGSQYFVQVLNESDLSLETFHLSKYRGDFQVLELIGNRVYAGCHCRQDTTLASANGVLWAGTPPPGEANAPVFFERPNSWASAFDATTGLQVPDFRPNVNSTGAGIWAIEPDGNGCVWFAGAIISTGSSTQRAMTRLCDTAAFDFTRPSTPGRPQTSAIGVDSVDFFWNPSVDNIGVEGYRLYDSVTNAVVASSLTTTLTVPNLEPGTYGFYVKAYDAAGNLSYRSGITTVTLTGIPPDTQRPSTPGKPTVTALSGDTVSLAWSAATDNVGVTGYRLYDAATNVQIATSTDPVLTLAGLADGSYSVYVKAIDAAGNLSWKSGNTSFTIVTGPPPDTERPSTPGKPSVVTVEPGTVSLTWIASTDNVGVSGYQLFDAATDTVVLNVPTNGATVASLAPGTYSFYVKSFDAAGNVSWKSGTQAVSVP